MVSEDRKNTDPEIYLGYGKKKLQTEAYILENPQKTTNNEKDNLVLVKI